MTVEQREADERGDVEGKLVQKMESYLRAHFDERTGNIGSGAVEKLLWQAGFDWLVNRGLQVDREMLKNAVNEALSRYRENWDGKVQGEDDRSHNLGRALDEGTEGYNA